MARYPLGVGEEARARVYGAAATGTGPRNVASTSYVLRPRLAAKPPRRVGKLSRRYLSRIAVQSFIWENRFLPVRDDQRNRFDEMRPPPTGANHQGELRENVRLQARAARGASPCKPLFGGTRT